MRHLCRLRLDVLQKLFALFAAVITRAGTMGWRVMRPLIAETVTLALLSGAVAAQPNISATGNRALTAILPSVIGHRACFSRKYDREHLLLHRKQQVTEMSFELRYERIPGADIEKYTFAMSAKLRTRNEALYASGQCETNVGPGYPGGNLCEVDCDGGGVSIQKLDHGDSIYVYLETPADGIAMGQPCSQTAQGGLRLKAGADDKVFLLNRAPDAVCRAVEQAVGGAR